MIPIQLTKAVVENGSDVGPFPPLPIHLCALCDLCGIPPHPNPETFSDDLQLGNQSPIFFFKSGKELGSFAFIYRFSVSKAVTFS